MSSIVLHNWRWREASFCRRAAAQSLRHIEMRSHEVIKLINIAPLPDPLSHPTPSPAKGRPLPLWGSGGIIRGKFLKTQMLNAAFWWLIAVKFLAFWKLGQEVGEPIHCWSPQPKSWGISLRRSLWLLHLCYNMHCPLLFYYVKLSSCVLILTLNDLE